MLDGIGVPELLIILVIVVLVFGVGRVASLGKELGTAMSEFRKGLREDDAPEQVAKSANDLH
jgi:sec-independent protein translocase protein TatA